MVIPPVLYYMFTPLLVVLVGIPAERSNMPKLRDAFAILASAAGIVAVWMIYNLVQASPDKLLLVTLGGNPPLGA
ncbi:hypothetical protein GF319_01735, partial [Candidatus Bathyarchaeota archaeon]|nr:hypothetical protein [Candidatus Bathyarchaeota archaeon]